MIIRCPECSTGFQLPDKRISEEGVKLRCSRCSHVFRVRADDVGDPEIYYQTGDNPETEDRAEPKKSASSSQSSNPFPDAGLDLKPKKSSAFGDLDEEEEEDEEMEAFAGALNESSEAEALEDEVREEIEEPPSAAHKPPEAHRPAPEAALKAAPEEEEEPAPLMGSGGGFGDPEDHVDDSFGADGPSFDPEKGRVEGSAPAGPPKKKGRHPVGAVGAPPTQRKAKASSGGPPSSSAPPASSAPVQASTPKTWDEADLEPHRIGGGGAMKVVTFLLLLSLVTMGFVAVVASLNDGFIDFKAFPLMLKVAFADGEYEPRPEWAPTTQPTVVRTHSEPVTVEGVSGEFINVGRSDHLLVLKGMVRNNESESFDGVELRAMITTQEGRVLRQIASPLGDNIPIGEFRSLRNVDAYKDLIGQGTSHVAARDMVPFTMVFEDLPETVIAGENYLLKVEVAGVNWDGGEPVAAQD